MRTPVSGSEGAGATERPGSAVSIPDTAMKVVGWGGTDRSLSPSSMRAALLRYRVMAYIVTIGLTVLCVVGIPLQYLAHNDTVVAIVGPIHGFAYIIYLAVGYDMARRVRWGLAQLIPIVLGGFIPGLAFVVERLTTPKIQADIDRIQAEQAVGIYTAPG